MSESITIYTKTGCPYCAAAKEDYSGKGIAYVEVNLSKDPSRIPEIVKLTGRRDVPVIVDGGKVTVGFAGGS